MTGIVWNDLSGTLQDIFKFGVHRLHSLSQSNTLSLESRYGDSTLLAVSPTKFTVLAQNYYTGTQAPTGGTYSESDICWNTQPALTGILGWYCTSSGTPGTWRSICVGLDISSITSLTAPPTLIAYNSQSDSYFPVTPSQLLLTTNDIQESSDRHFVSTSQLQLLTSITSSTASASSGSLAGETRESILLKLGIATTTSAGYLSATDYNKLQVAYTYTQAQLNTSTSSSPVESSSLTTPTNLSDLTNDVGFLTASQIQSYLPSIPTKLSQLSNDVGFITSSSLSDSLNSLSLQNLKDIHLYNISTLQDKDVLSYNAEINSWTNRALTSVTSVNTLTGDVKLTTDNIKEGLEYFYLTEPRFTSLLYRYLSQNTFDIFNDVNLSQIGEGTMFVYTGNTWRASTPKDFNYIHISDLADVLLTPPALDNQILMFQNLYWRPFHLYEMPEFLIVNLRDVQVTNLKDQDILVYHKNTSSFINKSASTLLLEGIGVGAENQILTTVDHATQWKSYGTSIKYDVGTNPFNVVQLTDTGILPLLDGSLLYNLSLGMHTLGDMIYYGNGKVKVLPAGNVGDVLTIGPNKTPEWEGNLLGTEGLYKVKTSIIDKYPNFLQYKLTNGNLIKLVAHITDDQNETLAVNFDSPLTFEGDILANVGGVTTRLPLGDPTQVLTVSPTRKLTWSFLEASSLGKIDPLTILGNNLDVSAPPQALNASQVKHLLNIQAADIAPSTINNQVIMTIGGITTWADSSTLFTPVIISSTPPTSPYPGLLWWNQDTGGFYLYYSDGTTSAWMGLNEIAGSGISGGLSTPPSSNIVLNSDETQILKYSGLYFVAPGSPQKYLLIYVASSGTAQIKTIAGSLLTTMNPFESKTLVYDDTDWYVLN